MYLLSRYSYICKVLCILITYMDRRTLTCFPEKRTVTLTSATVVLCGLYLLSTFSYICKVLCIFITYMYGYTTFESARTRTLFRRNIDMFYWKTNSYFPSVTFDLCRPQGRKIAVILGDFWQKAPKSKEILGDLRRFWAILGDL